MAKPNGSNMTDVERVREAADIVRIVGEHVALKAKGREYVGLCPFHEDHNPSMAVVPTKQIFHCFVCGTGGDVFSFIQKYHRMDFREALEHLAERCNIELTPRHAPPSGEQTGFSRSTLADANAQAAAFFRAVLQHETHGRAARDLIDRRGISPEMVEKFAIGAAPDRWDGLCKKIDSMGADPELFVQAGLLKPREDGSHYDALRNRLIFPIRDKIGRVIGFGARRINDEDNPKYLNSPETPLFNKSASIFGLFQAMQAIQRENVAIITEGYTDVIACHQAGIENTVATLGTALTSSHARELQFLCDTVVLLFDGDDAGQRAADRAVEIFFQNPIDVRIATLNRFTDAKDPDELLKRIGGRELFDNAIAAGVDILDYRFSRLHERVEGTGISTLQRAIAQEIQDLARLGFHKVIPIRRRLIINRLAQITGMQANELSKLLHDAKPRSEQTTSPNPISSEAPAIPEDIGPRPLIEALGCILSDGALWTGLDLKSRELLAPESFGGAVRLVAEAVEQIVQAGRKPDLRAVLDTLEDGEIKAVAVDMQTRAERQSEHRLAAFLTDCLRRAMQDRSLAAARETQAETDDLQSLVDSIRTTTRQFGDDRRRMPSRPAPR